jgi:hypothetical protein
METKLSFKTAVCTEYECLLLLSKAAFDDFRTRHSELRPSERNSPEGELALRRLREDYEASYSRLVSHFDDCELCQSMSELSHRGETRYAPVIPFRRRSA